MLGGLESQLFGEFVKGFTSGFLALRTNAESLVSTLKTLAVHSPFPCFAGKDAAAVIDRVRQVRTSSSPCIAPCIAPV